MNFLLTTQERLEQTRDRVVARDPALMPALERLLRDAKEALAQEPPSVLDKKPAPPSGDEHDDMSLSTCFWTNPDAADGLPWVSRDGGRNPECDRHDQPALRRLTGGVEALTLAWALIGREDLALRAAELDSAAVMRRSARIKAIR